MPKEKTKKELIEENRELEMMFDLRHNADMRAIKAWQKATGETLTMPDQADLCVWLMDQIDMQRQCISILRKRLEKEPKSGKSNRLTKREIH